MILLGVVIFAFVLLHRCSVTYKTDFDFKTHKKDATKNDTIKIDSNEVL